LRTSSEVASIVHDLRNPLAAIRGSAAILVRSRVSQSQVQRIARNMYRASVRMRELLEFLDQSQGLERLALSDVHDLVASAVDQIAGSAELQSVHIVQAIPEGLVIALDRRRMGRVLINLVVNALEAMPNGGTIHISAVSERCFALTRGRLFQSFATPGKASGIGQGLAFSRQVVIDHGGEIWAELSSQGACFAVRLPMGQFSGATPPADIAARTPAQPAAPPQLVSHSKASTGHWKGKTYA
jgi:signal transduction histidine kinase